VELGQVERDDPRTRTIRSEGFSHGAGPGRHAGTAGTCGSSAGAR
jgi:hypothetical protein